MTLQKFVFYNETKSMPQDWIGQGYGYKADDFDWDNGNPDDIIYIPEYGYEEDDDENTIPVVKRENAYSKNDFLRLANGDDDGAQTLFLFCDWQYPESTIDEGFFGEENDD